MGKRESRPLATPKPLNRSSQKFAYGRSWISTDRQNLVTIPQGVSFPRMREIAHQKCLFGFLGGGLPTTYNRCTRTDFHAQCVKRRGFAQECAVSGLENKNLTFNPPFLRLVLTGQNFRPKTTLQWGDAPCKLP